MTALFYLGKDHIEVQETEVPRTDNGEVLIRVRYAGICGSDLSIIAGKHPRAKPPLIMGHEFSGEVVHGSSKIPTGCHVVVEPLITCGECYACRSGFAYVCQNLGLYGIDAPGAFAEYIKVPENTVHLIPDELGLRSAALIEPLSVAVHAVRLSGLKVGDSVCVLGAGPVGLLTALVARLSGASRVMISEREPYRLQIAGSYGLDTIDAEREDLSEAVWDATDGVGVDVVFEAAGAEETVLSAPSLCRVRGEIVQIAMPKVPRPLDIVTFTFREIRMTGVRVYAPFDFQRASALASEMDLKPLLSENYSLDDADKAFRMAAAGSEVMKVVFRVGR